MKILVTGAAGFIGAHTARQLLKRGDSVVGIDNLNDYYDPQLKLDRIKWVEETGGEFTFKKLDLAGMYFSAMEIGLTRRDLFRFMCLYTGKSLRNTLREDAGFWQRVEQRAQRLYQKGLRKGIVGLAKDKQGLPNE